MSNILLENGQPLPLQNGASLAAEGSTTLVITVTDANVIGYSIHNPATGMFYEWATGKFSHGFAAPVNVSKMVPTLNSGLFSTEYRIAIPNAVLGTVGLIGSVIKMDQSFTVALEILKEEPLT